MQDITRRENIYERDKLFQEVWSVPMLQLAKRYGISNNGLKKVCKKTVHPCATTRLLGKGESGTGHIGRLDCGDAPKRLGVAKLYKCA